MPLFDWFRPHASALQITTWAVDVARRCQPDVARRLSPDIHRMSFAEARGYVRARSASLLDDEISQLRQRTACHPALAAGGVERKKFKQDRNRLSSA